MDKISFEDFKKVEIKIGKILSAEPLEGSDKLLVLMVDFGDESPRQILSGIAAYFPAGEGLVGKLCAFATNIEPRIIRGKESNGMILAVSGENFFSLLETANNVLPGSTVA